MHLSQYRNVFDWYVVDATFTRDHEHRREDEGTQWPDGTISNGGPVGLFGVYAFDVDYEKKDGWQQSSFNPIGSPYFESTGTPRNLVFGGWQKSGEVKRFEDWLEKKYEEYGDDVLNTVQTALTVASLITPPGVSQALALVNLGISAARGEEVTALDVALAVVPWGKVAQGLGRGVQALGASGARVAQAGRVLQVGAGATGAGFGLYGGYSELRTAVKEFGEGEWTSGLRHAANGGAALFHGAKVGLATARMVPGRYAQCQERQIYFWNKNQSSCFAAGTPVRTPDGAKAVEKLRPGDLVWARDESDPSGPVVPRAVEANFVRTAVILHLHVGGEVIRTTAEHPFYVRDAGWVPAGRLQSGDLLASHGDRWTAVEEVFDTGEWEAVYNVRVAEYHTYFLGGDDWAFSVWAHNANYTVVPRPGMPSREVKGPKGNVTVYGKAQNTTHRPNDTHARSIRNKVKEMVASGDYEYIVVNRSWRTALGRSATENITGNRLRPDIIGIRRDGSIDVFEKVSGSNDLNILKQNVSDVMSQLPEKMQGAYVPF